MCECVCVVCVCVCVRLCVRLCVRETNYSPPTFSTNACSTDWRTEIRSFERSDVDLNAIHPEEIAVS